LFIKYSTYLYKLIIITFNNILNKYNFKIIEKYKQYINIDKFQV